MAKSDYKPRLSNPKDCLITMPQVTSLVLTGTYALTYLGGGQKFCFSFLVFGGKFSESI